MNSYYRTVILLPFLLFISLLAVGQNWSSAEIRDNAQKFGELSRLREADRLCQDSTGYMGTSFVRFNELARVKHGINVPGPQLKDSIHTWTSSCLPKSYLDLEAKQREFAEAEQAQKDSIWNAYQSQLQTIDSLVQILKKADTDSLPDHVLIPMFASANVYDHVADPSTRVFMLVKMLYGVKEANRLKAVSQKYFSGQWDLEKVENKTPKTRDWPSVARQRGGSSSSGAQQACGEWLKGGCGLQIGNPQNNRRGNHRK
jgi:hypothetical protein